MTDESIIRKRLDNRRPKGELLRTTGGLLEKQGYEIRVLDLLNMEKSHCFNTFVYIHSVADAQKMVTNFFKATTP